MAIGMLKATTPAIGVDFGASTMKVLQIAPGERPSLIAASCVETPAELLGDPLKRLEFQLDALPGVIRKGKYRGKRLIISAPAAQTWVQHLQVQRADGANMSQLVSTQLQTQTGHDPSSLVIRHYEVCETQRGSSSRTETICIATRRGLVLRMLQTLRAQKLEVAGVHSEHIALTHALPLLAGESAGEGATVLLDLGYGTSKLVIAHGSKPVFAKTIEIAGRTMDELASEQLGCGLTAAQTRRLRAENLTRPVDAGESEAATAVAAPPEEGARAGELDLSDQLEALTDEISMCVRYHNALFPDAPAARAVFVGGETRHEALGRELARALRLSAHVADPMAPIEGVNGKGRAVNIDLTEAQPGWALPLGLCLSPADI